MALNSMTQSPMTAGILDTVSGPRVKSRAAARREAVQWPWPLPVNSVLAVFDHPAAAFGVLESLRGAGIAPEDKWIMTGEDGASALRESFARRGALARLRSVLDNEDETVAQLMERTTRGGAAVLVRSPAARTGAVVGIVCKHGARLLRRTGRWLSVWGAHGA
jgi:hypothetical protein